MESQLFEKIPSLQIIICRPCKHAVRPADVQQHLKRQHGYNYQAASQVADMVHQWEDVQQDSQAIQIPRVLDHPLPILPCHTNGVLCQRDPTTQCQYVAASMNSMRKHWQATHQWSRQARQGRVGQREKARSEAELARSFRQVAWQQAFPSGPGSHYIHIQYPDGRQRSPPLPPPAEQAQQAVDAMVIAWERARAREAEQATIQADEAADANPWLRMTGWARYLDGVHPQDLRQLVEAPVEVEVVVEEEELVDIDPKADPTEQAVRVIWDAMDQLARRSQRTVQQCGAGIHVEAARTEAGQTPYKPLQAYMDEASIEKHMQPWQQVLAFIARTQAAQASWVRDEDGDSGDGGSGRGKWLGRLPAYGMTPRQRQKWQALWQLAMLAVERPEAEAQASGQARAQAQARPGVRVVHTFARAGQIIEDVWSASPSPGSSPTTVMEMDEETDEEIDNKDEVEAAATEVEAWQMTPVEQACLEFCIELMNQRHRTHEYESALVCAMAVQG
ncbi:hypothetical protein ASPCAL14646 [Aspergillus calidoustus]|uniref:DUF3505 multi-domain protein n=1 Tax=Aspergillus calidoustus TaxID=454130 RepID=A0A0U5CK84_ASPCI|nr:hypothetical protein ASPCAL14646 [Aspergillus calidoustus]